MLTELAMQAENASGFSNQFRIDRAPSDGTMWGNVNGP